MNVSSGGEKKPISEEGMEKLKAQIEELNNVARPEAVVALAASREYGDLSENADYEASRSKLNIIDAKISELKMLEGLSQVVNVYVMPNDGIVRFGSVVELLDLSTNKNMTITLTSEFESDTASNKFSVASPFARGMLGSKAGDVITINAPSGKKEYEILKVSIQQK